MSGACDDNTGELTVQIDHSANSTHDISNTLREVTGVVHGVETVIHGLDGMFR